MSSAIPEGLHVSQERWDVLTDVLLVLTQKEKTPMKVILALDKMSDITPLEKMLMVYALANSHIKSLKMLSQDSRQFLPVVSMS